MFDPDLRSSLVIEHGADRYGVIAPLESIVSIAIYSPLPPVRKKANNTAPSARADSELALIAEQLEEEQQEEAVKFQAAPDDDAVFPASGNGKIVGQKAMSRLATLRDGASGPLSTIFGRTRSGSGDSGSRHSSVGDSGDEAIAGGGGSKAKEEVLVERIIRLLKRIFID